LNARNLPGVRFVVDSFTPRASGDQKYDNRHIAGIKIDVTNRNAAEPGRICAAILWTLSQTHRDSLRIVDRTFDERFGSTSAREAIVRGTDPDVALGAQAAAVSHFEAIAAKYRLYQ
jgi:uncharacterized protein YbbC (DUF1343 family)